MKKNIIKLGLGTVMLGFSALHPATEILANEAILQELEQSQQNQVTSVSQLSDVSPTDWAYEALRNLVERYGCIAGYPDRTFRGNRALSRYEFAAGLNACMQQIERLVSTPGGGGVGDGDLATIRRLLGEFETELATLGTRVDTLEGKVAFLEDNQFSTTTKLAGEVVFGLSSIVAGQKDSGATEIPRVPVLGNRTRLELTTSFTGKDELFVRLATGNFPDFADTADTAQASLAFAQPEGNDIGLEVLNYRFPLGAVDVLVEGAGGAFDDFTDTVSILDGDGGSGALSVFGTRNLVYYQGEGAGLGLTGNFGDRFNWSLGYLASEGANPADGSGLFDGAYGAIAQLGFTPSDNFTLAFAYGRGYNTSEISAYSGQFKDVVDNVNTTHDTYAVSMSWRLNPKFVLGGWGGLTNVSTLDTFVRGGNQLSTGNADLYYWAVSLGFPDLFREGNLGGVIVGQQPKLSGTSFATNQIGLTNDSESYHIEAFYQYALSDRISITPGVVVVTNPNNDTNNSALVIGTIRTTFSF